MSRFRAIDLYSGVGGWSLGLRMAGVEVVASYEVWSAANETNFLNNRHQTHTVDVRRLPIVRLPKNIDFIVGSPPCTQFSFSNRGGNGNIEDGLRDIVTFLKIVDYLRPKAWVMENVPRVFKIIQNEMRPAGRLSRFSRLGLDMRIFNMAEFGLPQRRQRCLIGNIDFDLLSAYGQKLPHKTLGSVIHSLSKNSVTDPLYGLSLQKKVMTDHIIEDFLNEEEERINRASKIFHPVYNSMRFPDPLKRSVRTITATCTRVSRESVIIEDRKGRFRRLTVRERACLQGFPITFQFYAPSYAKKLRMIGNAMPPLFAFYVAQALKRTKPNKLIDLKAGVMRFRPPIEQPPVTPPDGPGRKFRSNRSFKFAIPSLRLKSGVRFELFNEFNKNEIRWSVAFYFGHSKAIKGISLKKELYAFLIGKLPKSVAPKVRMELRSLSEFLAEVDIEHMQDIWAHKGPGKTRPFMVLDRLDEAGSRLKSLLSGHINASRSAVRASTVFQFGPKAAQLLPGVEKLVRNATLIHAGLLIGSVVNMRIETNVAWLEQLSERRKAVVGA